MGVCMSFCFGYPAYKSHLFRAVLRCYVVICGLSGAQSQWPRGLRRGSAVARVLGLWVPITPGACLSLVSVAFCQVDVSASG